MKNLKKILSLALALLMLVGVLAACGGNGGSEKPGETTPNGGFAQINKAIVAYNSSGYGDTWLRESARVFNEMYAAEGYEIELKISYGNESNATLEIGKGADKNDVDLYLGAGNLEKLLDASNKTMRGQGAVLVDLKDVVWNKPAIGADKQEEEKTVAERFLLDEEYLYYDGIKEEFHGGIYCLLTRVRTG